MLPLQSAKPAAHEYWHALSEQPVTTVFAGRPTEQSLPHPPQLSGSLPVLTSQPSAWLALQSVQPVAHAYWQLELAQPVTVMFVGSVAEHWLPQLPQFCGSVAVLVSQPSRLLELQSTQSPVHAPIAHEPDSHEPAALAYRVVQSLPHDPQLVSVVMFVSQPGSAVQSPQPAVHEPT